MEIETLRRWFEKEKRGFFLIFLPLCGIFLLLFLIIDPPLWWHARNDITSTKKFTPADGKFSIEIPRSWHENKNPNMPSFGDKTYLNVRGEVRRYWALHSQLRRIMYADLSVAVTTLPPGSPTPSAAELGDELNVQLIARREVRARAEELYSNIAPGGFPGTNVTKAPSNDLFEVNKIKGYQWAKTTLTIERETFIFWQAVDDRLNHYIVTFATDNISHYEPIFENIIKSFSFNNH